MKKQLNQLVTLMSLASLFGFVVPLSAQANTHLYLNQDLALQVSSNQQQFLLNKVREEKAKAEAEAKAKAKAKAEAEAKAKAEAEAKAKAEAEAKAAEEAANPYVSRSEAAKAAALENALSGNMYPWGQCTWGVKELAPWAHTYWGNATDWAASAAADGFTIGTVPVVGAIAVWTDPYGGYGHVAYVTAVESETSIEVLEANIGGNPTIMNYRGFFDPTTTAEGVVSYIYPTPDTN